MELRRQKNVVDGAMVKAVLIFLALGLWAMWCARDKDYDQTNYEGTKVLMGYGYMEAKEFNEWVRENGL